MNWKFWTWPRQIRELKNELKKLGDSWLELERSIDSERQENDDLQHEIAQLKDSTEELSDLKKLRSEMPIWSEKDDIATDQFFLKTESGQRLMQALEAIGHLKAQNAVCGKSKEDREYNAHIAGGWFNCVFYLKSLSRKFQLAQTEQNITAPGDKPFDETYSP